MLSTPLFCFRRTQPHLLRQSPVPVMSLARTMIGLYWPKERIWSMQEFRWYLDQRSRSAVAISLLILMALRTHTEKSRAGLLDSDWHFHGSYDFFLVPAVEWLHLSSKPCFWPSCLVRWRLLCRLSGLSMDLCASKSGSYTGSPPAPRT